MYKYSHTFKHVHVQNIIHSNMYMYSHTFKHVHVQSNMYMYSHTFKHVHVHNIQSYIQTYTCT